MINNRPCYGCGERTPTCHSNCPKYAEAVKENAEKLWKLHKAQADDKAVREVRQRSFQKHQSKKHGG